MLHTQKNDSGLQKKVMNYAIPRRFSVCHAMKLKSQNRTTRFYPRDGPWQWKVPKQSNRKHILALHKLEMIVGFQHYSSYNDVDAIWPFFVFNPWEQSLTKSHILLTCFYPRVGSWHGQVDKNNNRTHVTCLPPKVCFSARLMLLASEAEGQNTMMYHHTHHLIMIMVTNISIRST